MRSTACTGCEVSVGVLLRLNMLEQFYLEKRMGGKKGKEVDHGYSKSQENLNANDAKRRITRKNILKFAKFVHSKNSCFKHVIEIKTRQATLEKP
jgi:hypothetical protein